MAITSVITLTPDSVGLHERAVATLVISNSGAASRLESLVPFVTAVGDSNRDCGVLCGVPLVLDDVLPAGGSLTLTFGLLPIARPSTQSGLGSYSVQATVQDTAGYTSAAPATMGVNGNVGETGAGMLDFSLPGQSGLIAAL
jgi:hypothetical protein